MVVWCCGRRSRTAMFVVLETGRAVTAYAGTVSAEGDFVRIEVPAGVERVEVSLAPG
jgi:hypothetical protein